MNLKCKCGRFLIGLECVPCSYTDPQGTIHTKESCSTSSGGLPQEIGAIKFDTSKPDISLIPYIALQAEAKAFAIGETKYGRYNYCKGHLSSQLVAAAQRHLLAWFDGEENDPIDGQPHLGSVRACCAMILRQQELGTLKDNRYNKQTEL